MNHINQFHKYIELVSQEIVENNETLESSLDQTWDDANDSEYVIYYGKALRLIDVVSDCDNSLVTDAISEVEDQGSDTSDFWKHCTLVSYHIIRLALDKKVNELWADREKAIEAERYKKEERSLAVKCRHYAKRLGLYIQKDYLHDDDERPAYQLGWGDHPQESLLDEWEDSGDNHPYDWHECYKLLKVVERYLAKAEVAA